MAWTASVNLDAYVFGEYVFTSFAWTEFNMQSYPLPVRRYPCYRTLGYKIRGGPFITDGDGNYLKDVPDYIHDYCWYENLPANRFDIDMIYEVSTSININNKRVVGMRLNNKNIKEMMINNKKFLLE